MSRSFINLILIPIYCLLTLTAVCGQEVPRDSLEATDPYGLRVGVDLSRPLISLLNEDYTGIELVGDFRIRDRLFLAAEIGNEEKSQDEILGDKEIGPSSPIYSYTTSGSYIKAGINFNTYQNWYGMNNVIYFGGRYAFSSFSHTLNSFSYYNSNRYWNPSTFTEGDLPSQEFDGLNASWIELVVGVQTELFANFYMGASTRVGYRITNKESDDFPNLWLPGFNKVTDGSNFGVSFNYTLSYFLPIYKKRKVQEPKSDE